MQIKKESIEPGENKMVRLIVGRLPSATPIHFNVHVYRSKAEGPTALVMGGVHGDEINGVEIIRRAIASGKFEYLKRGSVIAIPVLNIYGFNNFSRDVPDGKDVNRSFPGSSVGSLASRVASLFSKNILPLIDFGIDLHTGGAMRYNYPQIRYTRGHEASRELAEQFGAPITISTKTIPKSLRKTAIDAGKPIIVYEGGENLRLDGFCIERGLAGIERVLAAHGMLEGASPKNRSVPVTNRMWLRAKKPGMFRWWKQSGQKVRKGEPLGVINDPFGQEEVQVISPKEGIIIGHNNAPVVGPGDALFHVGW